MLLLLALAAGVPGLAQAAEIAIDSTAYDGPAWSPFAVGAGIGVLSWLTFGALLVGRWRYGWRGAKAVHWTLTAMALLLLAFFGSKFVYEMVLRRA